MRAFLAMVEDTWRLSMGQIVFIVCIVLCLIITLAGIFLVEAREDQGETKLAIIFEDEKDSTPREEGQGPEMSFHLGLAYTWAGAYVASQDHMGKDTSLMRAETHFSPIILNEVVRRTEVSVFQMAVKAWLFWVKGVFVSTVALLLFVAACSGYFPGLLQSGAIDAVIARPNSRLSVFLGRYLGGLVLFAGLMLTIDILLFLSMGLRFDTWQPQLFLSSGILVFTAALIYGIISVFGIFSRSSLFSILMGYTFYILIDTGLAFIQVYRDHEGDGFMGFLGNFARFAYDWLPNISMVKDIAAQSILALPEIDGRPLYLAIGWSLACLALGFWKFNRSDY